MSATYDPITGRITLSGATTTWSRTKSLLPTPPTGTTCAIYVMRFWNDGFLSDALTGATGLSHDAAQHIGFSFNSSHPNGPTAEGTGTGAGTFRDVYRDFFGLGQLPNVSGSIDDALLTSDDTDAQRDDYSIFSTSSAFTSVRQGVHFGNGDTNALDVTMGSTTSKSLFRLPFTMPVNETFGLATTYVWQVYSGESNESVYMRSWVNTDTIDLSTFNLSTDLDPTTPQTAIPVSNSWDTGIEEINTSAQTGTNWRPSSGVMGFPTHFMARYAADEYGLIIDYLGVQYSDIWNL